MMQVVSGGTKGLKFKKKTFENVYENTHISTVRQCKATLQLALQEEIL